VVLIDVVVAELQARPHMSARAFLARDYFTLPCLPPRRVIQVDSNNINPMSVMTLLDAHLEQISLCAQSITELPYATPCRCHNCD
jgi:hypothetical protein